MTRWRCRAGVVLALVLTLPVLAISPANAQVSLESPVEHAENVVDDKADFAPGETQIGDSALAEIAELAANTDTIRDTTRVPIEVHGPNLEAVREAIVEVGGESTGEVPGFFVEARVPITGFETLNAHPAVSRINQVTKVAPEPTSSSLANNPALTNIIEGDFDLDIWHEQNHVGEGQRIGILDIFGTAELQRAIADNRIPAPTGTFCRRNGRSCQLTVFNGGGHGVAVAEIAHQAAPEAELFLASVATIADLAAAVEWFASQGVTVINRSETSEFDGPGDGTGPTASIVDRAIELDMVWVAAAGNAGGGTTRGGQNWLGEFNDPDGNGFHNFENGAERMAFTCGFLLGMRWDDWGGAVIPTDYDIWIYDTPVAPVPEARGDDAQATLDHVPLEHITPRCSDANDIDYLSIRRFADLEPDGSDVIQILGNLTVMAEWDNPRAATGPGNDSANPGAVIVGATERPGSTDHADFSSQGPTFDGRNGVDILAPSCLPVPEFFAFCFSGTSATAPVITGVVAVLRGAGLVDSAADIDAVLAQIAADGGIPGPDPQYGHGVLSLPSPASFGLEPPPPLCRGLEATIVGTDGPDVLNGTSGIDVIVARGGNDTINSFGGADVICAGRGADTIFSGGGADIVFSGFGNDSIFGGGGNDTINGGGGVDKIRGNTGNDTLAGAAGRDNLGGGPGNDVLSGGRGPDLLAGGIGSDRVFGGNGDDICRDALEHSVSCRR